MIINPGDIIMGDHDGCLVVPQECEADLMRGLERFLEGNGMFGKVAAKGLAKGIAMSEHPALEDMFRRKYKAPNSYWPTDFSEGGKAEGALKDGYRLEGAVLIDTRVVEVARATNKEGEES